MHRLAIASFALLLAASTPLAARAAAPEAGEDIVVKTLPGIEVDTKANEVRLSGRVVQNSGALELLVCHAGIREHESVVAVEARPADVTFALALLGLDPGKPGYYTPGGMFSPPAGAVLDVTVRFHLLSDKELDAVTTATKDPEKDPLKVLAGIRKAWAAGKRTPETVDVAAEKLLLLGGSKSTVGRGIDWVYVGRPEADALKAANEEGTVVCLSNFPEAVIDVPFESTDVNAELLYQANPKAIPPVWTPAEVVVRPTGRRIKPKKVEMTLVVEKGKDPVLDGKRMDLQTLDRTLSTAPATIRSVYMKVAPAVSFGRAMKIRTICEQALMKVTLAVLVDEEQKAANEAGATVFHLRVEEGTVSVGGEAMGVDAFSSKAAELLQGADVAQVSVAPDASWKTVARVMAVIRDQEVPTVFSRSGLDKKK